MAVVRSGVASSNRRIRLVMRVCLRIYEETAALCGQWGDSSGGTERISAANEEDHLFIALDDLA